MTFHAFCLRHRGYAFRESVDVEEPLDYLLRHPDFTHPFLRAANLIRRNRDILFVSATNMPPGKEGQGLPQSPWSRVSSALQLMASESLELGVWACRP